MAITMDRVLADALLLNDESRILLAERLIASIAPDGGVLAAQVALAGRRADEMENGTVQGFSGADALMRVRDSLQSRAET